MQSPERRQEIPVQEKKEEFEVPPHLKDSLEAVETAYKAQVKDSNGKNLTQSAANTAVAVQIPSDTVTLESLSKKGSIKDSITWFAAFWLRAIKKAIHFGKKIIVRSQ